MIVPITIINDFGLFGLLVITFLSASIVPFPSEPAIVLSVAIFNPALVFIISLIGYVAGGVTNYYIGFKGLHNFFVRRSPKQERKAQKMFHKWGAPILLIAPWIPFIGDPLLIIAGLLKMNFKRFLSITIIAKAIKILVFILIGRALIPFINIV
jgi:membrane protein YqaA with SNARE-associated domain